MHPQRLSWRQWIERASGRRRAMGGAGSLAGCEAVEVAEAVEAARRGRVAGTSTSKRSQASKSLGTIMSSCPAFGVQWRTWYKHSL